MWKNEEDMREMDTREMTTDEENKKEEVDAATIPNKLGQGLGEEGVSTFRHEFFCFNTSLNNAPYYVITEIKIFLLVAEY
jgi:hypothetical protein